MNCWLSRKWYLALAAIVLIVMETIYDTYCKPHK